MRVAVLFDNFGPYHIARLAGAAKAGLDVLGVQVRAKSSVYAWESPAVPLNLRHVSLALEKGSSVAAIEKALERSVAPFNPDAIALSGWATPGALVALSWALRRSLPAVVMSESNSGDFRRFTPAEWIKRAVVSCYSAGLVGGTSAKSYLTGLGMLPETVFLGYDAIDNGYFEAGSSDVRLARAAMPRIGPGKVMEEPHRGRYLLASARFAEKKNLLRLLDAYDRYRRQCAEEPWPLVILGDGALRRRLERRRTSLGLDALVHLPGFRQYGELPQWYGTAGAFVHASTTDQWGLVVNEAMASGLPVVVSLRCGCAEMLVQEGVNGFTFDPHDVEDIALGLQRVTSHPERESLGRASLDLIREWGPERFGAGLANAVRAAVLRKRNIGPGPQVLLHTAAAIQARRG